MAVFYVYFDESGKFTDTKTVAFCGVVAYESDWTSIGRSWQATLKDVDLPFVKMADAMNWTGPFKNWNKNAPERADLRDSLLLKLVNESCSRLYGISTVPSSSQAFLSLSEEARRRYRDTVYMAFESSMRLLVSVLPQKDVIHLCCDSSEEYSQMCLKLYHRLKMQNQEIKTRFRALAFAEEEQFPGLQLVDIIAYCEREIVTGKAREIVAEIHDAYSRFRNLGRSMLHDWHGRDLGDASGSEI